MAPGFRIDPGTDDDREWCAALMARTDPWITLGRTLNDCRARIGQPDHLLFVARAGDAPCGFVLLDPQGVAGSPYIASIAVSEEYRGRGIGRCLVRFAEEYFARESRHIFLSVSSFNRGARALYERLGYEAVGRFDDYVIPGASEILMHKWLGEA